MVYMKAICQLCDAVIYYTSDEAKPHPYVWRTVRDGDEIGSPCGENPTGEHHPLRASIRDEDEVKPT